MKKNNYVIPCIFSCCVEAEVAIAVSNEYTNKIDVKVDNAATKVDADAKQNVIVDFSDDDCWE